MVHILKNGTLVSPNASTFHHLFKLDGFGSNKRNLFV